MAIKYWGIIFVLIFGTAFPIIATDNLARGNFYQIKFKYSADKENCRYIGLYTQKTLDADLMIFDERDVLLAKISGSYAKYPSQYTFPGSGVYTAKVVAYSGEGPFLMLISDREELKKVFKETKD